MRIEEEDAVKKLIFVRLLASLMMMAAPSIHSQGMTQPVETKEVKSH
jgi:hypothetical protein